MTPDLDAIARLLEKATPGTWHTVDQPWLAPDCQTYIVAGNGDPHCSKFVCDMEEFGEDEGERDGWNDAELICALKNAAKELLAAARRYELLRQYTIDSYIASGSGESLDRQLDKRLEMEGAKL